MNIFILDSDPIIAAQNQCDKHVVKMVLESAQLLCGPYHLQNTPQVPYKHAHKHHPCSRWTGESTENYEWLLTHANELSNEYTFRFKKVHASKRVIDWCSDNFVRLRFTRSGLQPFVQAMPETYRCDDAVTAYRKYYLHDKVRFAKWNRGRAVPEWFNSLNTMIDS